MSSYLYDKGLDRRNPKKKKIIRVSNGSHVRYRVQTQKLGMEVLALGIGTKVEKELKSFRWFFSR